MQVDDKLQLRSKERMLGGFQELIYSRKNDTFENLTKRKAEENQIIARGLHNMDGKALVDYLCN